MRSVGERSDRKEKIVLIIEAGEYALSTRKLVLESAGLNVLSAVSAEQAFELLKRAEADLALVDTDITDEPLKSIAAKLRNDRGIPVYMISGREWPPEEVRGLVEGSFQKASDPQIMVNEVLNFLGKAG